MESNGLKMRFLTTVIQLWRVWDSLSRVCERPEEQRERFAADHLRQKLLVLSYVSNFGVESYPW